MKFIYIVLALMVMGLPLHAQLENVYRDHQLSVSRIYAGINSTSYFPVDSISAFSHVNFRLGLKSELTITEQLTFKTWGVMHLEKNKPTAGYNSFEIQLKPTEKMSLHTGLLATPTTVLRPNPTTWQSQVETTAQGSIIPGRPGVKASYQVGHKSSVTYGFFNHEKNWAHHINLSVGNWQMAGYWLEGGLEFVALKYVSGVIENTTTYTVDKELNSVLFLNISNQTQLIIDGQYVEREGSLNFSQTGIRQYFDAKTIHAGGFFGLTYDWESRLVMGQLFMYLF